MKPQIILFVVSLWLAHPSLASDPQPENPGGGSGQVYYLDSVNGNNGNDGLATDSAWRTLQFAIDKLQAGDTLLLLGGEYYERIDRFRNWRIENKHGSEGEYITLRNYPGQTPSLKVDTWNGLEIINSSFIEVDGLEFRGLPDPAEIIGLPDNHPDRKAAGQVSGSIDVPGDFIAGNGVSSYSNTHHIRIRNCHVHSVGGNGIALGRSHIALIENNLVWHTSHRGDAGNSGISVAGPSNSEIQPEAYGLVVRNNVVHGIYNRLGFKFYLDGQYLTDGNGIIVDWLSSEDSDITYPHRTLVANNIVFACGGRGIHAFESSFVDIVHNTVYQNNWSEPPVSSIHNDGDLSSVGPNRDINFFNNIAVARDGRRPLRRHGTKALSASAVGLIEHNLLIFNPASPQMQPSSTPSGTFMAAQNFVNGNAGLASPSVFADAADFRLLSDSDAIGSADPEIDAVTFAALDMLGRPRAQGLSGWDLGALQHGVGQQQSSVTVTGGSGSGDYPVGSRVRIVAEEPSEGMMFYRWRGDITRLNSVYSAAADLLVPATDILLTAEYKPYEEASQVAVTPAGGVFSGLVEVKLTATQDGSFIYYTTDGSEPGLTNGEIWDNEGSIQLVGTTNLKIIVWAVGYAASPVASYHFIFQESNPWDELEATDGWKWAGLNWLNDRFFPHVFHLRNDVWLQFYPLADDTYFFYDYGSSAWHYGSPRLDPWSYSFAEAKWINWNSLSAP